jgi:hypothetical protein
VSVFRLVLGVVCLAIGASFFRARARLRATPEGTPPLNPRVPAFITVIAWLATLLGVLWVLIAL